MKAGLSFALTLLVALVGLPLVVSAGHGHHRGHHHGGSGYGGGYGGCGCGAQVQYAPPAYAQYGQPTPAIAQAGDAGYRSFSYAPTEAGAMAAEQAAPAAIAANPNFYPAPAYAAPAYGGGDNYGYGFGGYRRGARVYNNVANKTLGNHDYGIGRR
jgi:hypothetical protein